MERDFQNLNLNNGELSTVHEHDEQRTLTKENIKLLSKQKLLQKFAESPYGQTDDDEDFDFETGDGKDNDDYFDLGENVRIKLANEKQNMIQKDNDPNTKSSRNKLKSAMKTPTSNNMLTLIDYKRNQESTSTFSSRNPSSISSYSENETENSDYAEDFVDFQNNINLVENFQRKRLEAKQLAEQECKKFQHYRTVKNNKAPNRPQRINSQYYENDFGNNDLDTDDFIKDFDLKSNGNLDPTRLNRFRNNLSPLKSIGRKQSMPLMKMGTSLNGSPKKVKRYSSIMDMKNNFDTPLSRNYSKVATLQDLDYPVFTGNELDDANDFDLTITLSDYKKLKRKSQRFDLSKYAETPSKHYSRKSKFNGKLNTDENDKNLIYLTSQDSHTAKLTREGKIKLIRALGRPKIKKVMPGHLYGEIFYDPVLKKWCGNEEDLVRFESVNRSKPQLINKSNDIPQTVGNMIYDDKKLRWVSITGSYEDDPFGAEPETTITSPSEYELIKKPILRGASNRLVPSESNMSLGDHLKKQNKYSKVTPEMYKHWKLEEERWIRKVGNWFPNHEDIHDFKYELKVFLNQQ